MLLLANILMDMKRFDIELQEVLNSLNEVLFRKSFDVKTEVSPVRQIVQMLLSDEPQVDDHPGGVLFIAGRIDSMQKMKFPIEYHLAGSLKNALGNIIKNNYPISEMEVKIPAFIEQARVPLQDIFSRLRVVSELTDDNRIERMFTDMMARPSEEGRFSPFVKVIPSEEEIRHQAEVIIQHVNRILEKIGVK